MSGQYILCQDRYIMEAESQNHRYQNMLFQADEAFLEEEKKKEVLKDTIHVEREGYDHIEAYYKEHERKLKGGDCIFERQG